MASSFASINFEEHGQAGLYLPIHGFKINVAILHIPKSDKVIIQCIGYGTQDLDMPVRVTSAQLASLRGKVGTTGSLVYTGGTITTQLMEVGTAEKIKTDTDMYFTNLKFLTQWYQ